MTEIFFFEAFQEEAALLREQLPAGVGAGFAPETIQECAPGEGDPPAPVISVRTQSRIPVGWAAGLAGILTRSTGYDHITRYRTEAARPDLPAGYLPLYCHRAVAEQAMLLWTALLRRLPLQIEQFRRFERSGLTGRECAGRTLVVFGVGNIGHEIARIGGALGMTVRGVDIDPRHADVTYLSPEAALKVADIVVCAMNLTPANAGWFSSDRLDRLPRGALFINVARGELAPAPELLRALESGRLSGVGLDVYTAETRLGPALRSGDSREDDAEIAAVRALAVHPRALLTPHNAFNTEESVRRKAEQSVRQLEHFRATGRFLWPVPEGQSGA